MEKPTNSENPEEGHHQLARDAISQSVPAARSNYECTLCKRGFSNAQALGEHMNIHRKDKAKLMIKQPAFSIHETKQAHHKDQMPAAIEHEHDQVEGESGKGLSPPAGRSSSDSEILDLELRLGPQRPQDSSSSANMANRKFF